MVQTTLTVRRLINRRAAAELLEKFLPLLPRVTLSLVENNERVVARAPREPQASAKAPSAWSRPLCLGETQVGHLRAEGEGLTEEGAEAALDSLHHSLTLLLARGSENRSLAEETLERYREINLLYNIGDTISASLDPDAIPDLVLAEAMRIIHADVGVVLLEDDEGVLTTRSGFGEAHLQARLPRRVHTFLEESLQSGDPFILTDDQLPPFDADSAPHLPSGGLHQENGDAPASTSHPKEGETPSENGLKSFLAAPLKAREQQVLGFVILARRPENEIFTADDEKLLVALAGQAAIAVQNARLFADVKSQRDAIAAMKNYMDNIFASIASGVITTDVEDLITTLNRAAGNILGVREEETMGKRYTEALPALGEQITPLVNTVKEKNGSVVGHELQPVLPDRGQVILQLHVSPLKDNHENTTGVAIVVDDLTERRKLEAQVRQVRSTFERYVAPRVVERLLSDPASVRLGGVRQEVSILFADVRGFTSFSERVDPTQLVEVLNRHLNLAAEAVLAEDGTLDKFIGDAVMAIFNAPLAQPDHSIRAVRAALAMQRAIAEMHAHSPEDERLSFGVGIVTGQSVVGNIGSSTLQNYTAIGDSVNLAARLQSTARPGQVLLNPEAYEMAKDHVIGHKLGYVQVKGHSEPDLVYEVIGLKGQGRDM
jgi:PAS domain S-box-containing protein